MTSCKTCRPKRCIASDEPIVVVTAGVGAWARPPCMQLSHAHTRKVDLPPARMDASAASDSHRKALSTNTLPSTATIRSTGEGTTPTTSTNVRILTYLFGSLSSLQPSCSHRCRTQVRCTICESATLPSVVPSSPALFYYHPPIQYAYDIRLAAAVRRSLEAKNLGLELQKISTPTLSLCSRRAELRIVTSRSLARRDSTLCRCTGHGPPLDWSWSTSAGLCRRR